MFLDAIKSEKGGGPASNQEIIAKIQAQIDGQPFAEEIRKEIARQGIADSVRITAASAPARPKPGEPDIKGVHFFNDNRTMLEDFTAAFYAIGHSDEGERGADEGFDRAAGEKERRLSALTARIDAVRVAIENSADQVVKTELRTRATQLAAEKDNFARARLPRKTSVAAFIVAAARRLATDGGAGRVEIRDPHIGVRLANAVIIDWGFTLIDLANYEGLVETANLEGAANV